MKLRVLEILATLRRAGAERIAVSLACALDRSRFDVEVVSLYDAFPNGFEPDLAACGVPSRHLGKRRGFDPRIFGRLRRCAAEFRADIVHTHSYVLRYALTAGAPVIVHTVHNMAEKEVDRVGQLIHRFAFRRRASAVAISQAAAQSFRGLYGFEPSAVIPNGLDLTPFGVQSDWRERNGFSAEDFLMVSVARLEPQKNPLGLLDAFAAAATGRDRWKLLLAGEGSLLAAARARAADLGIAGQTHFLGVRKDIPEMLAACDLFALASDWEGSPVAVIEALAAGLPIVATAVGGVPELVTDGETGILVRPADMRALAHALACVAKDEARRTRMSECARARAARFGIQPMVDAYSELFERLAREKKA